MPGQEPPSTRLELRAVEAGNEPLWRGNLLLAALSGATAGVIVSGGDFDAPRWIDNAWLQLVLLAAIVVAAFVGMVALRRGARRRMHLAVLFSLLVHLVLLVVTGRISLPTWIHQSQIVEQLARLPDLPKLPDYHVQAPHESRQRTDLERPVETPLVERPRPKVEQSPQAVLEVRKEASQEPRTVEQRPPEPTELRRAEAPVSRQSPQVDAPALPREQQAAASRTPQAVVPKVARQQSNEPSPAPPEVEAARRQAVVETTTGPTQPTTSASEIAVTRTEPQRRLPADSQPAPRLPTPMRSAGDAAPAMAEASVPAVAGRRDSRQTRLEAATAASRVPAAVPQSLASRADIAEPSTRALAPAVEAASARVEHRQAADAKLDVTVSPAPLARTPSASASDSIAGAAGPAMPAISMGQGSQSAPTALRVGRVEASRGSPAAVEPHRAVGLAEPVDVGSGARAATVGALPRAAVNEPGTSGHGGAAALERAPRRQPVSGSGSNMVVVTDVPATAGLQGSTTIEPGPPVGTALSASVDARVSGRNGGGATTALPAGPLTANSTAGAGHEDVVAQQVPSVQRDLPRRADTVGDAPASGAAGPRAALGRNPSALAAVSVTVDGPTGQGTGSDALAGADMPGSGRLAPAAAAGGLKRQETAGPTSLAAAGGTAAVDGPAALAAAVVLPLRSRAEAEPVEAAAGRLILEKSGSRAALDARVWDTAVPGFKQRDPDRRGEIAQTLGGTAGTERAVEMGLDFLARHQSADGHWSLHDFGAGLPGYESAGRAQMQSDTAGTGLALLAFLGAGYTHTDGKYRVVVGKALDWLLGHQKVDGDLFVRMDERSNLNVWLYSHGIAAIALCEAYGMTRDPALRDPAQRALDFIVAAQHPEQGGWRYSPRAGSDTSVSGWQLMALKSGELAGLEVPARAYALVSRWLDHAQGPRGTPARYAYRPESDQPHQRAPSHVMTAEALLMRQYLGWTRDNPHLSGGADYLKTQLPSFGAPGSQQRDAYYWYYATQVMFQMQGDYWQAWNGRLRPLLTDSQVQSGLLAGSWDPLGATPDRWGAHAGRIYVTAMHLLLLEVYYRHLPLYRTLEQ